MFPSTMSSFPNDFQKAYDLFLKFNNAFNNVRSFSMSNTSS